MERKIRTYLDDVPEDVKEQLSRTWGERRNETYPAAQKHGIRIEQGESFNKVLTFELYNGFYHLVSGIVSTRDISPEHSDVGSLCSGLIERIVNIEKNHECVPMLASNVCDWDSGYAREVGANVRLRDSVISSCIKNDIILTGGETANLGDQVRKKGMSWMFALLSKYEGSLLSPRENYVNDLDLELYSTSDFIADRRNFRMVYAKDMPLLYVRNGSMFVLTADGTGSKSVVENQIKKRTDILDTLAMCCDDATRENAFPLVGIIGVHAEDSEGRNQIVSNMIEAGKKHLIPFVGCTFHVSDDVSTYIMNGVVLSEVRKGAPKLEKIDPDLDLVLLYEEQRSNGITLQRRILEETFGEEWYNIKTANAFDYLKGKLGGKYSKLKLWGVRSLGELVGQPSTPYFRVDSMMPKNLMDKIKFRINVSSGGLFGKTRRLLEPFGVGAYYYDAFDSPDLITLIQMASQIEGSKGVIPDEVAYYTWGCGNGEVIGTWRPNMIRDYYVGKGIDARIGGCIIGTPEIKIMSKCLDSRLNEAPYIITHKYSEKPLG